MREQNVISEQSVISAEEMKELIERLSDPSFRASQNQTTVKDLAETLDLDPVQIAGYLQNLRQEKLDKSVPVTMAQPPQTGFISPVNIQYRKLAFVMIFTALGITLLMFLLLLQPSSMAAPSAPPPTVEAVPGSQQGHSSDAPVAPPTNPPPNTK